MASRGLLSHHERTNTLVFFIADVTKNRFCFVEYSNVDDAAKAIRALHGRKLYGRPLRVRFMTVEGKGRMDYSTTDSKGSTATGGGFGAYGYGGGGRSVFGMRLVLTPSTF